MYDLVIRLNRLPYNNDLSKLCNNIADLITDLSRLEVYTRRTPPRSRYHVEYNKQKKVIQDAITHLDNLMLIATLMA